MHAIHRSGILLFTVLAGAPAAAQTESFEKAPVGPLAETGWVGTLGRLVGEGGAISTRRARTGARALRILGGRGRQVELRLPAPARPGIVSLWAERWTRRAPFEFRVEARVGDRWELVYRDTGAAIRIGGYHARVEFAVADPCQALRFECTSPAGAGLLLDDLSIVEPRPMRIVGVTTEQPILPVLAGRDRNPLARVRIDTVGHLQPVRVRSLRWRLRSSRGEEFPEIAGVSVFYSTGERFPERGAATQFGTIATADGEVAIPGNRELAAGANYFWLSVGLHAARVDPDGFLDAGCVEVVTSAGKRVPATTEPAGRQRFARVLRDGGDDGVHTYRIPGITTTDRGTLIAVYDVRRRSGRDLPGDIDVGMSRSTDGGRSWQPMRVILDMGSDPDWRFDGVGDPAILFDTVRNTLWVAATWSHGDRSWVGSGPGLAPAETGQLLLVNSTDDGVTWSKPINITRQVKDPQWCFVLQSPGRGITTADGTLVFGAQYQASPAAGRTPHSTILYSKDHGGTWRIGRGARANTTECQPVEVAPGRIMLNMRDNRRGARSVMVTDDLGQGWRPHASDRRALIEPTCNAGLLAVRAAAGGRPAWLVFVNPAVAAPPRRQMTVKLSIDGGRSWPAADQLLIDAGISAGYPSLTPIDADTIGVLYESSRAHLVFQRIPLAELRRGSRR